MSLIVKKYGGSSVETIELIDRLAAKLAKEKKQGDDIVVVVSAMAKSTDYLFSLARQISETPYQRELDMLVTVGERISSSLLSIALHKYGVPAISFTGSQSGIITDDRHGNAKIIDVNAFRIKEELEKGKIVIVAGFQGVSRNKEVTTLGRGGSDTTAVALAGYLGAEKCQLFKDVDGIYSADPKSVQEASIINKIDYQSMIFLCLNGCNVVHPRAIELAKKYSIPVEVKSSFTEKEGTLIIDEELMNEKKVSAITYAENRVIVDLITDNPVAIIELIRSSEDDIYDFDLVGNNHIRYASSEQSYLPLYRQITEQETSECRVTNQISSITVIGNIFDYKNDIMTKTLKLIKDNNVNPVWLKTNPYGFTLYVKNADIKTLVQLMHKQIIE